MQQATAQVMLMMSFFMMIDVGGGGVPDWVRLRLAACVG